MTARTYFIYKGLQRPLVFKVFKGRFIYMALGALVGGITCGIIASILISAVAGLIVMALISIPLLMFTIEKQKHGLYEKRRDEAVFIIPSQHSIYRKHEGKKVV